MMYGKGASLRGGMCLTLPLIWVLSAAAGAWFNYEEQRLGQGRENVKKYMLENPDFTDMIENRIREQLDMPLIEVRPKPVAEE